jgi:predicted nucleic acid-binding protein
MRRIVLDTNCLLQALPSRSPYHNDAEYIVTNDSHFNILKHTDWPKLTIIAIKEFYETLE